MHRKVVDLSSALFFAFMWDWNGTLINDARYFYYTILIPILESFGADMSEYKTRSGYEDLRTEYSKLGPKPFVRREVRSQKLRIVLNDKDVPVTWDRDVHPLVTKLYARRTPSLMAHADAVLDVYSKMGIPMGLVSGMPQVPLLEALEKKGVMHHFDFIIGGVSDKTEIYQEFVDFVNCTDMPEVVLSITDMGKDIAEANTVGMTTVGIDKGYGSAESLQDAHPSLIISDLLELRRLEGIRKMQRVGDEVHAI